VNAVLLAAVVRLSAAVFIVGVAWRLGVWVRAAVPLRIPLTPAPATRWGAWRRLAGEVIGFKALFKADRGLWAASWLFHLSLVLLLVGHLGGLVAPDLSRRVLGISAGAFLRLAHVTGGAVGVLAAGSLLVLLGRRLVLEPLRHVSTLGDYFALTLLLLVIATGNQMRFMGRLEIDQAREFVGALLAFRTAPAPSDPIFAVHLLLVCALLVCLPFSKLMHAGGIFLSPTLNQANDTRERRHSNPWDLAAPRGPVRP
jgi:nitrate reductase gamma subunit